MQQFKENKPQNAFEAKIKLLKKTIEKRKHTRNNSKNIEIKRIKEAVCEAQKKQKKFHEFFTMTQINKKSVGNVFSIFKIA
jgi:hypothetical protein